MVDTAEYNTVIMNIITLCRCVLPLSSLVSKFKVQVQSAQLCNQSQLLIANYHNLQRCLEFIDVGFT